MSVIIEIVQSYDARSGSSDRTNFIAANINSIQTVVTNVRFETYRTAVAIVTTNPESEPAIVLVPNVDQIGRGTEPRGIWISDIGTSWEDFHVGDQITIVGATKDSGINNITANILEIIDEDNGTTTLITDHIFATVEILPKGAHVGVTTPQVSVEYKYNWIENLLPASFISAVDSETQRALFGELDYTDLVTENTMIFQGKKSYQFESITIRGNGKGNGIASLPDGFIQAFVITHRTFTGVPTTFDQYDNVVNNVAPASLLNGNSLKYVNSIGLSREVNNPNDLTTVVEAEILGNVGFYGENLNGGDNKYSFEGLVFKRIDNTVIERLELTTNEQKIQFSVFNTETSPFSDGNSIVIAGMHYAPSDPSLYRDNVLANSNTMHHNFIIDEIVETLGSGGTATALNDGTILQSIISCVATYVSDDQIDVEIRVKFAPEVTARIGINATKRYVLYFEVSNHTLERDETDKVQLKLDVNDFFVDVSDPGLITMDMNFMTHPNSDLETEAVPFVNVKPEDDLLTFNNILLDLNGRETDDINFVQVKGEVIVRRNTGASFIVNQRTFALSPELIITDDFKVPLVELDISRGFKTPADENRANIKFFRVYSVDGGGFFGYRWQMPHIWRWETFIGVSFPNLSTKQTATFFFDNTEQENGLNQDWFHYSDDPEWDIYYRTTLLVNKNGNILPFFFDRKIEMSTYLANDDWISEEVKNFDPDDNELVDGATGFVNGALLQKMQANFTFVGAVAPIATDLTIVFKIRAFEEGTYKGTYWASSAYDIHVASFFTSIDTSNRVVVTDEGGGLFRGEVILIGPSLPKRFKFDVAARLYDNRGDIETPDSKLLEDRTLKVVEGSTEFKDIE